MKKLFNQESKIFIVKFEKVSLTQTKIDDLAISENNTFVLKNLANARPDEPIDLRKSKGCKECIGFVKFTPDALERYTRSVIKRALELRDGIHEQVWKEVSENFSENF